MERISALAAYVGHCLNLPHTKYGFTIHFGRSQGDILAYVAPVQRSDRQGNSLTKRYNQSLNCHRLHSGPPQTWCVHTHTLPILCMPYPSLRSPGDILRERAPVLSCDRQDNSITKRFAQSCNCHRVHQQPQAATKRLSPPVWILRTRPLLPPPKCRGGVGRFIRGPGGGVLFLAVGAQTLNFPLIECTVSTHR